VANPSTLKLRHVSKNNGVTATLTVVRDECRRTGTNGSLAVPSRDVNGELSFVSGCTGTALAAGASCSLVVSLNPSTVGP